MLIKDLLTGTIRKYGKSSHDSLRISTDGRTLSYENLQNGDGSRYGDYRFVVDEEGKIPAEEEELMAYGGDAYFNIGGFSENFTKDCAEYLTALIARDFEAQGISKPSSFWETVEYAFRTGYASYIERVLQDTLMNKETDNENQDPEPDRDN